MRTHRRHCSPLSFRVGGRASSSGGDAKPSKLEMYPKGHWTGNEMGKKILLFRRGTVYGCREYFEKPLGEGLRISRSMIK